MPTYFHVKVPLHSIGLEGNPPGRSHFVYRFVYPHCHHFSSPLPWNKQRPAQIGNSSELRVVGIVLLIGKRSFFPTGQINSQNLHAKELAEAKVNEFPGQGSKEWRIYQEWGCFSPKTPRYNHETYKCPSGLARIQFGTIVYVPY
jgi:hypothetical protein